jgi:recombination protein RecA
VKVVKNKMAPPFRKAEFEILYGEGSSREGEIIDLGVANNLIEKAGSWYSYNGDRVGQGKDNARNFLKENPEIAQQLETALREKLLAPKRSKKEEAEAKAKAAAESESSDLLDSTQSSGKDS